MLLVSFYVNILATFSRENTNNLSTGTPATNLRIAFIISKQNQCIHNSVKGWIIVVIWKYFKLVDLLQKNCFALAKTVHNILVGVFGFGESSEPGESKGWIWRLNF